MFRHFTTPSISTGRTQWKWNPEYSERTYVLLWPCVEWHWKPCHSKDTMVWSDILQIRFDSLSVSESKWRAETCSSNCPSTLAVPNSWRNSLFLLGFEFRSIRSLWEWLLFDNSIINKHLFLIAICEWLKLIWNANGHFSWGVWERYIVFLYL